MFGAKMQGMLVARNSSVAARKAVRRPSQSDRGPLHVRQKRDHNNSIKKQQELQTMDYKQRNMHMHGNSSFAWTLGGINVRDCHRLQQ
jgi:hypothetical protein